MRFIEEILALVENKLLVDLSTSILGTLLLAFTSRGLLNFVRRTSAPQWIISFIDSLKKPIPFIILGYGFFHTLEIVTEAYPQVIGPRKFEQAKFIFLVGTLTYLLLKWKHSFSMRLTSRLGESEDPFVEPSAVFPLSKMLSIVILCLSAGLILDIIGVPISTLLAFGGIGGLAISWAAKDVVANFFGGLMIYINRPFAIGDWIKSPNKDFEGVVEEIGWYRTQIRSFERRPTYIPNAMITDAVIENPGRMYNRRIKTDIGLRYQDLDKIPSIVKDIKDMLFKHKDIDQDQLQLVNFTGYGPYSLDINIYVFTKTTNWSRFRDVQQDVFLEIASIIKSHSADFAFPTQTLDLPKPERQTELEAMTRNLV